MSRARVVFFGSGAFGLPTLRAIADAHELVGVVSQPDRPSGRGGALTPTPIAAWAAASPTAPVLKPDNVNDPAVIAEIRGWRADLWIVIAFGQKLSRELLDGVPAFNLHASLLPRWRGAAPIHAAILAGDPVTGNSVITLADRMDAGLIAAQSRREIEPAHTTGDLLELLSADGPGLVTGVIEAWSAGAIAWRPQDETLATRARKLSKADGWLDFNGSPAEARRRVHALNPWPGVTVALLGQPLKLHRVAEAVGEGEPGTCLDPERGVIACGEGAIRLLEVQASGGKPMAWTEFARGRRVERGAMLIGGRAAP